MRVAGCLVRAAASLAGSVGAALRLGALARALGGSAQEATLLRPDRRAAHLVVELRGTAGGLTRVGLRRLR